MNISFTSNFLLSLAMISSCVFLASAQEDGPQTIVGGTSVKVGEYPWFTMLMYVRGKNQRQIRQGCGGMLVSPEYVLTAAHCINNNMKRRGAVRIGAFQSPYLPDNNGEQDLEFIRLISKNNGKAVTVHPNYKSRTLDNDFALLRLEAESTIAPVPLDSSGQQTYGEKYFSDKIVIGLFPDCELFFLIVNVVFSNYFCFITIIILFQ